jgi:hypothetical protein
MDEPSRCGENRVKHGLGQFAGKGVLLAGMVGGKEPTIADK